MEQIPQNRFFISGGMEPCLKKYLEISPDFDYNSGIVILIRKVFLLDQSMHRLSGSLRGTFIQATCQFILGERPVHPVAHQQNLIAGQKRDRLLVPLYRPGKASPDVTGQIFPAWICPDLFQCQISLEGQQGQVAGKIVLPIELNQSAVAPKVNAAVSDAQPSKFPVRTRQATKVEPPLDGQLWSAASTFSIAC